MSQVFPPLQEAGLGLSREPLLPMVAQGCKRRLLRMRTRCRSQLCVSASQRVGRRGQWGLLCQHLPGFRVSVLPKSAIF